MVSERKEPTVSSVLSSPEELASKRKPTAPRGKAPAPVVVRQSSGMLLWFTFLLACGGLAVGGYSLWQWQISQQTVNDQQTRIVELEKQLAVSDDSATQSLASVGVKVRDLDQRHKTAMSEIDKLWAARKANLKTLTDTGKKLEALEQNIAKANQSLKALAALTKSTELNSQRVSEQELLVQSLRERMGQQAKSVERLSSQVKKAQTSSATIRAIDARTKNTEEAITAFDAFRRTVNRDLLQLKQANSSVKKP